VAHDGELEFDRIFAVERPLALQRIDPRGDGPTHRGQDGPLVLVELDEEQLERARTDGFEVIVFAGHHNEAWGHVPAKPDPEPFRVACDALGVAPERTAHVGNAPEADVAGAAAAGLTSVLVGGRGLPDTPEPDHVVDSVAALDGLL